MSDSTELAEVSSILKGCDFCGLGAQCSKLVFFADLSEFLYRKLQVLSRVRCGNMSSDSSHPLWHDGIKEADHIDAQRQQPVSHLLGEGGIANHNRDNRMASRSDRQPVVHETGSKRPRAFF